MRHKREFEVLTILLVWLVLFLSFILNLPILNSDEFSNSTMKVSANLVEPIAMVNISPDNIFLGEITRGYETEYKNITITNIGTMDVKVSPILDENTDIVFQNLKFASSTCSSWAYISHWNSSMISHSKNYTNKNGGVYNFCIKLDLTDYDNVILNNKNLSANVTFWIMPA
jgi:hypothetical protein